MRDEGGEPLLTVIVPVYNEARTVEELLRRVLAAPYDKQVIVVDDGSTDGTAAIIRRLAGKGDRHLGDSEPVPFSLVTHSQNRGKGAAIRTGLQHARGRFTIIQDADLEYDPQDYPLLVEPLVRGEASVVYGSRNLRPEKGTGAFCLKGPEGASHKMHLSPFPHPWSLHRCGVTLLNWCVRLFYGARITDEATCYKAFPTAVLKAMDLECERFEFCPEVTAKACRMGLAICEVPIHYHARGVKEGKKLRLQDGWAALKTLWRWRTWQPAGAVGPALPAITIRPAQPALPLPRFGRHSRPYGFTIVELLVVIGIIGMLMALLLPAVQSARESARRAQCSSHLRQLGLAMQHHVSDFRRYPTNGWGYLWVGCPDRGTGKDQPGGWIYNILPYIEQANLRAMGRGLPPAQQRQALAKMTQTPVAVLLCPSRSGGGLSPANPIVVPRNAEWMPAVAKTDYAVNEGDFITDTREGPLTLQEGDRGQYPWRDTSNATGICFQRSQITPALVRDGASWTYLIGEKYVTRQNHETAGDAGYDQSAQSGVDVDLNRWVLSPPRPDGSEPDMRIFGSAHAAGCHFVLCDGAVRLIQYSIDPEVHRRLGNRRDGLPVPEDQY